MNRQMDSGPQHGKEICGAVLGCWHGHLSRHGFCLADATDMALMPLKIQHGLPWCFQK